VTDDDPGTGAPTATGRLTRRRLLEVTVATCASSPVAGCVDRGRTGRSRSGPVGTANGSAGYGDGGYGDGGYGDGGYGDGGSTTPTSTPAGPGDVSGDGTPPTDPDGDGLYEDVDGNGTVGVIDVVVLLARLDRLGDDEPYFDFDGNGRVNAVDVADLLGRL